MNNRMRITRAISVFVLGNVIGYLINTPLDLFPLGILIAMAGGVLAGVDIAEVLHE